MGHGGEEKDWPDVASLPRPPIATQFHEQHAVEGDSQQVNEESRVSLDHA